MPDTAPAPATPRRLRRLAWAVAAVALLGGAVHVFRLFEPLFFYPTREPFTTPAAYEDVTFPGPNGLRLHGWFIRPANAPAGIALPAVLHVHGNAGNVSSHEYFSSFLARSASGGVAVFIFDYRSYGRSDPAPSRLLREDLLADTEAAYACLRARPDVDPTRIGVLGVSVGSTFASALAAAHPEIRSLCLVSPFARWKRIASDHAPLLGWALVSSGLDPIESVTSLGARDLLVIHGEQDDIVRCQHGRDIAAAATARGVPASFTALPQAGHNNTMDTEEARGLIRSFFQRTLAR